jgi:hypothetical protein
MEEELRVGENSPARKLLARMVDTRAAADPLLPILKRIVSDLRPIGGRRSEAVLGIDPA